MMRPAAMGPILVVLAVAVAAQARVDPAEDDWPWQDLDGPTVGQAMPAGQPVPHEPVQQQKQRQHKAPPLEEEAPPSNILEKIIAYFKSNPVMACLAAYWILKRFKGQQPWPEVGGNVTKVHDVNEWDGLVAKCASAKRVLIVDAYALWCGPCKSCAESYARLSEALSEESCTFAKFDVDEAGELAKTLNVSSMPCFVIFKNGAEVDRKLGFPGKDSLKRLLMDHGAVEAGDDEEEDEEDEEDEDERIVDVTEEDKKDQ